MSEREENEDFPGSSATKLSDTGEPSDLDTQIKHDIEARIAEEAKVMHGIIDVRVKNGEVTLIGVVDRKDTKTAVLNEASAVGGVTNVIDQIDVKQKAASEERRVGGP
jgi:osmotically-inducible protein OsmY